MHIKAPNENLYKLIKQVFHIDDEFFKDYKENLGLDRVKYDIPSTMDEKHIKIFKEIVGN